MKKQLLTIIATVAVMALISFTYQEQQGLAKVKTIDGYEVYINCEPVKSYSVIGNVTNAGSAFSLLTVEKWMGAYIKKGTGKGYEFDALIIDNKWHAEFIKWKE